MGAYKTESGGYINPSLFSLPLKSFLQSFPSEIKLKLTNAKTIKDANEKLKEIYTKNKV